MHKVAALRPAAREQEPRSSASAAPASGGDIMSESGGDIISVRGGDFVGIRTFIFNERNLRAVESEYMRYFNR
jgi:hypothetical protein